MQRDVNNHIHTTYSFSPYTPEQAVLKAKEAGLATAGIMDHDTISGAPEFIDAGGRHGLPVTIGMECRVSFDGTDFAGMRLNNPDQSGIAYVALHGVPHTKIEPLTELMKPYRLAREARNRAMTARLAGLIEPAGLRLDYDRDVLPLSCFEKGGSVTERHILYAVALQIEKMQDRCGFMAERLGLSLSAKQAAMIADSGNPFAAYDILGILKASYVERFYLDASDECPPVAVMADFCRAHDIVYAYAYLGDVLNSHTGDKRPQTFEDAFLDRLVAALPGLGFHAVTYMPSRNTPAQLARLQALCEANSLFQISGEDINQPRQAFVCPQLRQPQYAHLETSAWALIGHELKATKSPGGGMFSAAAVRRHPDLSDRAAYYADWARSLHRRLGEQDDA